MKSFTSKDVFLNVPGRGDIYVIDLAEGEDPPMIGDVILLDGKAVTVTGAGERRGQRVGLLVRTAKLKDLIRPNLHTYVTWAAETSGGRVYLFKAEFGHSLKSACAIAESIWDMNFVTAYHFESAREELTRMDR